MEEVKICLVGVGGYGETYMDYFKKNINNKEFKLIGLVDPYIDTFKDFDWIKKNKIPKYKDLDDFLQNSIADLVILSTPIHLHKEQSIKCLNHGINVLCEKPLTPLLQDAFEIESVAKKQNKLVGVGFQNSFMDQSVRLKQDVINGVFGKPKRMKVLVGSPRYDNYYSKGWHGSVRNKEGVWVLDSVIMNAFAHYIHFIFWLLGDTLSTSKTPENIKFSMYRSKPIETFDTCFVEGSFENGASFNYIGTHACQSQLGYKAQYEFENAVIYLNRERPQINVVFNDGTKKVYSDGLGEEELTWSKIDKMIAAIKNGTEITSTISSVVPHLAVCNAMLDHGQIYSINKEYCYKTEDPEGVLVCGMDEIVNECYEKDADPYELNISWAKPSNYANLSECKKFQGLKFGGFDI